MIPIPTAEKGGGRERGLPRPHLEETELGFEPEPLFNLLHPAVMLTPG